MWTVLVAGMCAYMLNIHDTDYVIIGHVARDECAPFLSIGDGATVPSFAAFPHDAHVEIGEYGASLTVDDRTYWIPKEGDA